MIKKITVCISVLLAAFIVMQFSTEVFAAQDPPQCPGNYGGSDDCGVCPEVPNDQECSDTPPGQLSVCTSLNVTGTTAPGSTVTLTCTGAVGGVEKCGGPAYGFYVSNNSGTSWTALPTTGIGEDTCAGIPKDSCTVPPLTYNPLSYTIPAGTNVSTLRFKCAVYGKFRDGENTCKDWNLAPPPGWAPPGGNVCIAAPASPPVACGQQCVAGQTCLPMELNPQKPWNAPGVTDGWFNRNSNTLSIVSKDKYWNYSLATGRWTGGRFAEVASWQSQTPIGGKRSWETAEGITAGWISPNNILTVVSKDKYWSYSFVSNSWTASGTMSLSDAFWKNAPPLNGEYPWSGVGITGGWFSQNNIMTVVSKDKYWSYNPATSQWSTPGLLSQNQFYMNAPLVQGQKIWEGSGITGGWLSQNNILTFVSSNKYWSYNPNTVPVGTWTSGILEDNTFYTTNMPAVGTSSQPTTCDRGLCRIQPCVGQSCTCSYTPTAATPTPPPAACGQPCAQGNPSGQCVSGMVCDTSRNTCVIPTCNGNPSCTCTPPAATPTQPPTGNCTNCQYQVDLFWGPVIRSFVGAAAGNPRYSSNPRRLIAAVASTPGTSTPPACTLQPVSAMTVVPYLTPAGNCANPIENRLLTGSIDSTNINPNKGYFKATVRNRTSNCNYDVGFASYKADMRSQATFWQDLEKQNLVDSVSIQLRAGQTKTLYVASPMNNNAPSCHQVPANPS